ncbi:MAG: bifunctional oligoribonuclease/PAP phosphatase NrnA [Chitinophagales bacterium]|nr:bifunctional oligoribonuclease/PAP phosphatase NrnA [Bacteroidota bacterium]MCB9042192.1 bifunctional oligoribonuclease/PAP phosphatase NrnA [Chitinophagales bacterium]
MNKQALQSWLNTPRNIAITTHHKPDGDALGSSLALYNVLKAQGHEVAVISPSEYPQFLMWLPGEDSIIRFSDNPKEAANKMLHAEAIFCLDFNALSRINHLEQFVRLNKNAIKILIDHHLEPEDFAQYVWSDTSVSSTCELLLQFFREMNYENYITADVADCLYTGLVTDTGRFKYAMSPNVLQSAAYLLEKGADIGRINDEIYDSYSENRLRFLGYCLNNRLEVMPEYATAIIAIPAQIFKDFDHQTGDSEGLVNYPLGIKNIKFAALITENEGMVKLSLRSKGDFSVNDFARQHFEGGGHKNAAGGRSKDLNLAQVVQKFKDLLPQYAEQLNNNS